MKNACRDDDSYDLYMYMKFLIYKRKFRDAISVGRVLLLLEKDTETENVIELLERFIFYLNKKKQLERLDINEIAHAIEWNDPETHCFLDRNDGSVLILMEHEPEDMERLKSLERAEFVPIERLESAEVYRLMEEFKDIVGYEGLSNKLAIALNGPGAFRRFKDVLLEYPEARSEWFAVYNRMVWERALNFIWRALGGDAK